MGLDVRYPAVKGEPDGSTFPIYSEDLEVISRTTGANVNCFLPARRPGEQDWYRRPPFRRTGASTSS